MVLFSFLPNGVARAQEVFAVPPGASPEQARAIAEARARGGAPPNAAPAKPDDKKKDEAEKKEGDDKGKKDEEDKEPDSVKRPEKPPRPPDPREFDVKLDDRGRVPPFNFIGQPWPDVLQWLASISSRSLDWQELPNDYLNLTTQKSYSLDEVQNLINRHLHARGYTMLSAGEVMSVFKIEKLDPSLVPRVSEDELYDRSPYDFVKVSFELPEGVEIDKAKEDVKQVLSPNAKVFPLVTTKRLLVIDAVANQRLVSALLNEERVHQQGQIMPREFVLKYARAEQVMDTLYVVVGLDPKSRPTQMELRLQQQKMQLMMQMQQKGTDVASMLKKDGPPVFLAYNRQRNSILANAPPKEMRMIEQAIDYLDVPPIGGGIAGPDAATIGSKGGMRLEKYQLVTMDPAALQMTLEEIGNLDPRTQLSADTKAKMLFARATEADHKKIAALKDELDGTGRQLKVIWLPRRLPAGAVAGSIYNLMAGQDEEEEQQLPFYYYSRRNRNDDDKPKKGFRVDADIERNRLLLWANDAELAQVKQFLTELTQDAPSESGPRPVRVLEPGNDQQTARLLEHLRKAWPGLGDNELIIDDQRLDSESKKVRSDEDDASTKPAEDRAAFNRQPAWRLDPMVSGAPAHFAQFQLVAVQESTEAADTANLESAHPENDSKPESSEPAKRSPVTITVTPDGRLLVASQDIAALDRLEGFIDQLTPPGQRFKIFRLKYMKCYDVWYNLQEFYEDELKGDSGQILDWWGIVQDSGPKDKGLSLSKRSTLRIIYDPPTNSILVANASPSQLYEIEQLINEYDQPTSTDSIKSRRTSVVKIHYSRASTIAAAIKDVYRDLLSSKDKEFDSKDKKGQGSGSESVTVIRYDRSGGSDDGGQKTVPSKVGFEGALSIAPDDIANVLIVSAQEGAVFESVVEMIHALDEEARPRTAIEVHRVSGNISPKALQKALADSLGTPWPGGRPEKPEAQPKAEAKPKTENGKGEGGGEGGQ